MPKLATSGVGFFSTSSVMDSVFGNLLSTEIGTTAPFSAMLGALMTISLDIAGFLAPTAAMASLSVFIEKAESLVLCAST